MTTLTVVMLTLAVAMVTLAVSASAQRPPRTDIGALITGAGYPLEEHYVTTADGYKLLMQRIPRKGAKAVYLQHGLVDSAATWLVNEPNESLGFILYDAGYDVWFGNARGNGQSWEGPPGCDPSEACFWAFSWDQMASLDMPAMVAYVRATTGSGKIGYIGHSQGTMMAFAGLEPGDAASIAVVAALAPVARVYHVDLGPFKLVADLPTKWVYEILGHGEFNLDPATVSKLLPAVCEVEKSLCNEIVCLVAGCDSANLNKTRFDVLFEYFPSPTSVQDIIHFKQGVNTETFQAYDYGSVSANVAHYNRTTPPLYNLAAFAGKVGLFSGGRDKLADPTDVAWLKSQLPLDAVVMDKIYPNLGHADFVWGLNAHTLVYPDVLALLKAADWE
ncbi:carboxylic ester hydrolase [Thecamonas trahens ATCC 50062]|uniref:Lipase n=1 Tax=Thecamonas trahens ATCC 50062 TaxID=461836 RepID=A0A0L0DVH2_THETB|nr:carboxylic ester hydrolase [Thecamonas trahens ATCC 50062]KNC55538.1 carboxylic ester hydrolase [Thecamonas trahens ATCC 50062]|eukprot:XP_013761312.1 carboxylic ester hydrolase [Thecamonas trahens ATCC 50062]